MRRSPSETKKVSVTSSESPKGAKKYISANKGKIVLWSICLILFITFILSIVGVSKANSASKSASYEDDLSSLRTDLEANLSSLRTDLKADLSSLRTDLTDLEADIEALKTDLSTGKRVVNTATYASTSSNWRVQGEPSAGYIQLIQDNEEIKYRNWTDNPQLKLSFNEDDVIGNPPKSYY